MSAGTAVTGGGFEKHAAPSFIEAAKWMEADGARPVLNFKVGEILFLGGSDVLNSAGLMGQKLKIGEKNLFSSHSKMTTPQSNVPETSRR